MSESNTNDVNKIWMKRIRNFVGILGMILPWLALLGAILVDRTSGVPKGFWEELSISATYYITPPLVGVLTAASITLMCYKGYDLKDHVITALAGIFGAMIVIFPCKCEAAGAFVGFFQLPVAVSHIIHCASAVTFFVLLSYMSMFQFTLGKSDTRNQKIKKVIYRICAVGMIGALIFMPIRIEFFAKTFIIEAIALTFFGISWLVKGEIFGLLSDD